MKIETWENLAPVKAKRIPVARELLPTHSPTPSLSNPCTPPPPYLSLAPPASFCGLYPERTLPRRCRPITLSRERSQSKAKQDYTEGPAFPSVTTQNKQQKSLILQTWRLGIKWGTPEKEAWSQLCLSRYLSLQLQNSTAMQIPQDFSPTGIRSNSVYGFPMHNRQINLIS